MVCRTVFALALVILAGGCADNLVKERPATRASAAKPPLLSSATGESTVCAAYKRKLRTTRLLLRVPTRADREALQQREVALEALIADACE